MDVFPYLFIAAVVLFGPWVLLFSTRRRMRRERQEYARRVAGLTRRVYEVESSLKELKLAILSSEREQQHQSPGPAFPEEQQPTVSAKRINVRLETVATVVPAPPTPKLLVSTEPQPEHVPSAPPPTAPVAPPIAASRKQGPLPSFTQPAPSRGWFDSVKEGFNLEEALGANWLNKVGIVILVVGIAIFLAYQLRQVGTCGKSVGKSATARSRNSRPTAKAPSLPLRRGIRQKARLVYFSDFKNSRPDGNATRRDVGSSLPL